MSVCVPVHVGRGGELIWYKANLQSFERVTKARGKMADDVANVDIIKCVALFYKLGAAPKDSIRKEKFRIKLPRSSPKNLLRGLVVLSTELTIVGCVWFIYRKMELRY